MSTISTHLNWGSSYIVHDFYRRFVRPKSTEKELVNVGRVSTVVLMILAGWLALAMTSALDNFQIILQIRSEEHTSELQSRGHLVCRLLLEKKKKHQKNEQ